VLQDLVGEEKLPGWINRLATVTSYVPLIGFLLPASWVYPWVNMENDLQDLEESQPGVSYIVC